MSSARESNCRHTPDAQLTAFVRVLDATPTIPAAALPHKGMVGAFWSLQNPKIPPLPGDTIGSAVWLLSDGNFLLNDVNFNYTAVSPVSTTTGTRMSAMAMSGPPAPGGGGGTNMPAGLTNPPPNYGTNLWIAPLERFHENCSRVEGRATLLRRLTNLTQWLRHCLNRSSDN